MRDPRRIPDVVNSLAYAWLQHPDLRLTQLIWAAVSEATDPHTERDPFYIEDDVLQLGLDKMGAK